MAIDVARRAAIVVSVRGTVVQVSAGCRWRRGRGRRRAGGGGGAEAVALKGAKLARVVCSVRAAAVVVHLVVTVPTVARTAAARHAAHARCIGLHQQEERGREGRAAHRSPATAHRGTHAGSAHVRAPRMAGLCRCAAGSPLKTGGRRQRHHSGRAGGPRAGLESACACRRRGGGPAPRPQPCGRTEGGRRRPHSLVPVRPRLWEIAIVPSTCP